MKYALSMDKRYRKISQKERQAMIDDRKVQLRSLCNEVGSCANEERRILQADIKRLENRSRKVVFDTYERTVCYASSK